MIFKEETVILSIKFSFFFKNINCVLFWSQIESQYEFYYINSTRSFTRSNIGKFKEQNLFKIQIENLLVACTKIKLIDQLLVLFLIDSQSFVMIYWLIFIQNLNNAIYTFYWLVELWVSKVQFKITFWFNNVLKIKID